MSRVMLQKTESGGASYEVNSILLFDWRKQPEFYTIKSVL